MLLKRRAIGKTSRSESSSPIEVEEFELRSSDGLEVVIWNYGATIIEVRVPDKWGRRENVTLRLPDLKSYESRALNPYLGCTMGRFARCISSSRFVLDGRKYSLSTNIPPHHFHGGINGFDRHVWRPRCGQTEDSVWIQLSHFSPDGSEGYPGNLTATATFRVKQGRRLYIEYKAKCDRSTIVGLTNHSFWNLGGALEDHYLKIPSGTVISQDDKLMPNGTRESVAGQKNDFRKIRLIGETKIDHFYTLTSRTLPILLEERSSGRQMEISSNQSGIAVYSGDSSLIARKGICFQPSAWPDAPNQTNFPSAILRPGEVYMNRIKYVFRDISDGASAANKS